MNTTVDFDKHYAVDGYNGVAFYLVSWVLKWVPETYRCRDEDGNWIEEEVPFEGEWVEDPESNMVIASMVGDDHRFTFHINDLDPIDEEDYCHHCGQIGCTW